MLVVTAALSVSEQIKDAGAYAGLASILGLAVLSLLYFGQARELKRLREWAGRAPERTAELQEQANAAAAAAAERRVVAKPAAQPAVVRSPAQTPATAAGAAAKPGAPAAAVTAAGVPVPVVGTAAAVPLEKTDATTDGGGQETQAIPALDGAAPLPPAVPSVAAPTPIGPEGPPTDDNPVPLRQVSAGQPRRRTEPVAEPEPEPSRRPGGRTLGIAGGVAAALLVLVLLVTQLGGDETTTTSTSATTTEENPLVPSEESASTGTTAPSAPAVDKDAFQVFVLNGTTQNGLAAEFADTLETNGYRTAGTATAAVNNEPATEVYFTEGNRRQAESVARQLKVARANVRSAIPEVTVQAPNADVVVLIGADMTAATTP